jgi:hypothetical protein
MVLICVQLQKYLKTLKINMSVLTADETSSLLGTKEVALMIKRDQRNSRTAAWCFTV